MSGEMRIGIEIDDRLTVGGFGRGKWEQRKVYYTDTVVQDNETVDFLDDISGDDDDEGDIKNDAGGSTNGVNAHVVEVGIEEGEK